MSAIDPAPSLREAALRYAKRGWHVFPVYEPREGRCSCGLPNCTSPAKHPRTTRGLLDASADPHTIAAWWTKWPNASIGIATEPSGLVVLDVDVKSGGEESIEHVIAKYGPVNDTMCVLTGGGGQHYFFAASGNRVISRAAALGREHPGIDIRAIGGYVVAPPSLHITGRGYVWEASSARRLQVVPQWLIAASGAIRRAPLAGVDEGAPLIIGGERNTSLSRYAGRLRRLGTGVDAIAIALKALNATQCRPPLGEHEVEKIAASMARYAPAEMPQYLARVITASVELPLRDITAIGLPDRSDTRRYGIGIESIDKRLRGIRPGEFVVIGARQGQGKSALAETSAFHNSILHTVVYASLEMPVEDVRERMVARAMGVERDAIDALRTKRDEKFGLWNGEIDNRRLWVYRNRTDDEAEVDVLFESARRAGADLLYVDYTRHITGWEPGSSGPGKIVHKISRFAKDEKMAVVLISQLNRHAQDKRPNASLLQDTGRLEQDADKLLLLYRPFVGDRTRDHVAEIIVAKNRNGPEFRAHVRWNGPSTRLESLTREEEVVISRECCKKDRGNRGEH